MGCIQNVYLTQKVEGSKGESLRFAMTKLVVFLTHIEKYQVVKMR